MALRARFILLLVLTLLVPLLLSQVVLLQHFFDIQEQTYRNHLQTLTEEVQENLEALQQNGVFSCKLIATSGALSRYMHEERYRMPEGVAYRALLKIIANHLKSNAQYRSVYFVKSDGSIELQFDLQGNLPLLDRFPDAGELDTLASGGGQSFHWYSPHMESGKLHLMTAYVVNDSESTEVTRKNTNQVAGYIVISIALDNLKYFDAANRFHAEKINEHLIVLRHKGIAWMHTPEMGDSLFEQLKSHPTTRFDTVDLGGEQYLLEHDKHQKDIHIEALLAYSTLYQQATPAMLRNIAISLFQVILVGLIFYVVLNRWLITPLHNAQALTSQLRLGAWLKRPTTDTTPARDEVSRLVNALYDMSDALEKTSVALEHKREQAEQAERLKTEFLSNISHEIRTPVNIIVGIMARLEKSLTEPRQKEALGMAKTEALRLVKEIDELMLLADIETKKQHVVATEFYLPDLLQHCLASVWPAARQKGLSLDLVTSPATDCILLGDSQKISKIIDLLLENAVKFTDKGGVRFEVQGVPDTHENMQLTVSISDSGVGIPADALQNLGQVFRQGDGSHVRQHGGLGMGLAICRGFLALLDSELHITSTLGEGSTFQFSLELPYIKSAF